VVEQLSLRLETGLPKLPALEPMWPTPESEPFDSPTHLFEPIWGGHRALAYIGPARVAGSGDVRIMDPTGRDLTPMLPELSGLAVRVAARSAILDGELVCTDEGGRADDEALRARLSGERGRPVAFLVFDLLDLDGSPLLRQPLARRRRELRRVLRPGDEVVVVPAIANEGRALYDAVVAQGLAGVLARASGSPYLPGVRSSLWRSIAATTAEPAPSGDAASETEAETETAGSGTAPVLALFRRLPLLDDDPDAE
jgi:bifunctional non-homologous end joining protein LigD